MWSVSGRVNDVNGERCASRRGHDMWSDVIHVNHVVARLERGAVDRQGCDTVRGVPPMTCQPRQSRITQPRTTGR